VINPKRLTHSFILEVWIDPDGFDSFVDNRFFCSVCTIFELANTKASGRVDRWLPYF
jgi:hypothetical protein